MMHDFEIENGHFFLIKLLFLIIFFLLMEIENKTMHDEYTYLSARGLSADAAKLAYASSPVSSIHTYLERTEYRDCRFFCFYFNFILEILNLVLLVVRYCFKSPILNARNRV